MWFFLSAYDPNDLPGGSLDPLGFERGYLFFAEKILPGMTNVANCPRYFGVICSGVQISGVSNELSQKEQRLKRQEAILRLERLWALANVLHGNASRNLSGLRGVTYAQRHADWLKERGSHKTQLDFKLLSRQVPYGAIGMYGAVAENVKLLYRQTFELTPGLGEKLADAFTESTELPKAIIKVVREGGEIALHYLRSWGEKSYLWGEPGVTEAECILEMLHNDPIRSRFVGFLEQVPFKGENESELERLGRIAKAVRESKDHVLLESIEGIRYFEKCYRLMALGLERLLYLCNNNGGAIKIHKLKNDSILRNIGENLHGAVAAFDSHCSSAKSDHFKENLSTRLKDVLLFLKLATDRCDSCINLAKVIVERHSDVQHGKFDRGRRKMPWLQWQNDLLALSMTTIIASEKEKTDPSEIAAHPYRLYAADKWIKAANRQ